MSAVIQNPEVVVTELEDGAVLLNMESRLYYSLNNSGLDIWHLLESPAEPADVARRLVAQVEMDEGQATEAVSAFLEDLQNERLVVRADGSQSGRTTEASPMASGERRPFTMPELIRHDEPLHEVQTSPFDPQLPLAE
ncbi:MAG: PqqD family protein [Actinomycetota bacterium]|nr:PqqD family protein [Actinomycetota bacterium]